MQNINTVIAIAIIIIIIIAIILPINMETFTPFLGILNNKVYRTGRDADNSPPRMQNHFGRYNPYFDHFY